jgi:hypothetical protein
MRLPWIEGPLRPSRMISPCLRCGLRTLAQCCMGVTGLTARVQYMKSVNTSLAGTGVRLGIGGMPLFRPNPSCREIGGTDVWLVSWIGEEACATRSSAPPVGRRGHRSAGQSWAQAEPAWTPEPQVLRRRGLSGCGRHRLPRLVPLHTTDTATCPPRRLHHGPGS